MKKPGLGIALAALVSVSASAGIPEFFKTLLHTVETVRAGETIKSEMPAPSFTVTPSADVGGSITPNTAQTITQGSTTNFTVTPDT